MAGTYLRPEAVGSVASVSVWDELKQILVALRDQQPGALMGYPMPDVTIFSYLATCEVRPAGGHGHTGARTASTSLSSSIDSRRIPGRSG